MINLNVKLADLEDKVAATDHLVSWRCCFSIEREGVRTRQKLLNASLTIPLRHVKTRDIISTFCFCRHCFKANKNQPQWLLFCIHVFRTVWGIFFAPPPPFVCCCCISYGQCDPISCATQVKRTDSLPSH